MNNHTRFINLCERMEQLVERERMDTRTQKGYADRAEERYTLAIHLAKEWDIIAEGTEEEQPLLDRFMRNFDIIDDADTFTR